MTTITLDTLTPSDGVRFAGGGGTTQAGLTVAGVGDMNGDGIGDFAVGSAGTSAWVVYGRSDGFPANLTLSTLAAADGFRIDSGGPAHVAKAGDLNGDGLADLMVGSGTTNAVHVVYGKQGGHAGPLALATLGAADGVRINGPGGSTVGGVGSFGTAGDVNGDGLDDVIVGGVNAQGAYLLYGRAGGFGGPVSLGTLSLIEGVRLDLPDGPGTRAVTAAGDFNGDGIGDVAIGTTGNGDTVYLVYGRAGGFLAPLTLATMTSSQGLIITHGPATETIGGALAAADVNGDGRQDLVIGAPDSLGTSSTGGSVYVVYAPPSTPTGPLELTTMAVNQGFRILGTTTGSRTGASVAVDDLNRDGIADILIGADFRDYAAFFSQVRPGEGYAVFGRPGGINGTLDLDWLSDDVGFRIVGAASTDRLGFSIAAAGDANGDGFGDVLLGAPVPSPGAAFVVYGPQQEIAWTGTAASEGRRGGALDDVLNGRGGNDTLSGADGADTLIGGAGADSLVGGTGGDTLLGGAGDDTLDGGTGVDLMVGGGGDDLFVVDDAGDTLLLAPGGTGSVEASITWTLGAGLFVDLTLTGAVSIDGTGNGLGNRVEGNEAGNRLNGLGGPDTLDGGGGDDSLLGGNGADVLIGQQGRDSLNGGGSGDTLDGGAGIDTLVGGTGGDRFRFTTAPAPNEADRITDFDATEGDRLELLLSAFDPSLATGLGIGSVAAQPGRFESNLNGVAGSADVRFVYEMDAGRLYWDPDGNAGQPRLLIVTLAGAPPLAAADILLV